MAVGVMGSVSGLKTLDKSRSSTRCSILGQFKSESDEICSCFFNLLTMLTAKLISF